MQPGPSNLCWIAWKISPSSLSAFLPRNLYPQSLLCKVQYFHCIWYFFQKESNNRVRKATLKIITNENLLFVDSCSTSTTEFVCFLKLVWAVQAFCIFTSSALPPHYHNNWVRYTTCQRLTNDRIIPWITTHQFCIDNCVSMMLCCVSMILCCVSIILLRFKNIVLCFQKIALCLKNCLLCLQIWATVKNETHKQLLHTISLEYQVFKWVAHRNQSECNMYVCIYLFTQVYIYMAAWSWCGPADS